MDIRQQLKDEKFPVWPFGMTAVIPKELGNRVTTESRDFMMRLENYRKLLAATGAIDFECEFNKEGTCLGQYGGTHTKAIMCCCAGCAGANGYHYNRPMALPHEIPYYEGLWDKYLGFWRPEVGCTLDREMRSITCLFYNCFFKKNEDRAKKMTELIDGLRSVAWQARKDLENMIRQSKS